MATRGAESLAKWRSQAVKRIQATRRSMLAFIARLPEAEMLRPRTQDQWSVRDVLGHLTACDEETVRRFRLIARGRGDRIVWFESMADADRFNARTVAQARRLGLPALLRRMARAHADVISWLERLPTEALQDSSHAYTVVDWLPTPGWRHEQHHLSEVKAWWQAQRKARVGQRPGRSPATKPKESAF